VGLLTTTILARSEAAELLGANPNELLTREETAGLLRVTTDTLRDWEKVGKGPPCAKIGPKTTLYSKQGIAAYLEECRVASQAAKAPRPLTKAEREANEQALQAERRRCIAIMNRAPKGFEAAVTKAIRERTSIEDFDASLPGEYRAVMPPLHQFLADLDRPKDYAGEAAGQAILESFFIARK
jgi:hypothetical protein